MATVTLLASINDTTDGSGGARNYVSGTTSPNPTAGDQLVARVCIQAAVDLAAVVVAVTDSSGDGLTYTLIDSAYGSSSSIRIWSGIFVADKAATNSARTFTVAVSGLSGFQPMGCTATLDGVSGMPAYGSAVVRQTAHDSGATNVPPAPTFGAAALTTSVILGVASDNWNNTTTVVAPTGFTETAYLHHATPATGSEFSHQLSGFTGTTVTWTGIGPGAYPWSAVTVELDTRASVTLTANLSATLGSATVSAVATAADAASAGITTDALQCVAVAYGQVVGSASVTLAPATSAAAAAGTVAASLSATLGDATLSAVGSTGATLRASLAVTLGIATAAGVGAVADQASASIALGPAASASDGQAKVAASALVTLAPATLTSAGANNVTASAAITLGALLGSEVAAAVDAITASVTLGALVANGTAQALVQANMTAILGTAVLAAVAVRPLYRPVVIRVPAAVNAVRPPEAISSIAVPSAVSTVTVGARDD